MTRQTALGWIDTELQRPQVFGEELKDLIQEIRGRLEGEVSALGPREATRAMIKLHELDCHVLPALEITHG